MKYRIHAIRLETVSATDEDDALRDLAEGTRSFVNKAFGYVVAPTHYLLMHLYLTMDGGRIWKVTPVGCPR